MEISIVVFFSAGHPAPEIRTHTRHGFHRLRLWLLICSCDWRTSVYGNCEWKPWSRPASPGFRADGEFGESTGRGRVKNGYNSTLFLVAYDRVLKVVPDGSVSQLRVRPVASTILAGSFGPSASSSSYRLSCSTGSCRRCLARLHRRAIYSTSSFPDTIDHSNVCRAHLQPASAVYN